MVAPWPKDCRRYQYNNACNKYEISKDGKSVDSCNIGKDCPFNLTDAACLEYFQPTVPDKPIKSYPFPETGRQCLFREAIFPMKPWP